MIKYRAVNSPNPPTEAELDDQWKAGYELVSITGSPGDYSAYYKYTGGNRAMRSTIGRGN